VMRLHAHIGGCTQCGCKPMEPRTRSARILDWLRPHAGGSRAERQRAIDALLRDGFTKKEISDALAAETERLHRISERRNHG
jgi:uncharacterized membrane protein